MHTEAAGFKWPVAGGAHVARVEEAGPAYILWLPPRRQHGPPGQDWDSKVKVKVRVRVRVREAEDVIAARSAEMLVKGVTGVRERVQRLQSAQGLHESLALIIELSPAHVNHCIDQWRHRDRCRRTRSAGLGEQHTGVAGR